MTGTKVNGEQAERQATERFSIAIKRTAGGVYQERHQGDRAAACDALAAYFARANGRTGHGLVSDRVSAERLLERVALVGRGRRMCVAFDGYEISAEAL